MLAVMCYIEYMKKECIKCKENKDLADFPKKGDKVRGACRLCWNSRRRERYSSPSSKRRKTTEVYRKANIDYILKRGKEYRDSEDNKPRIRAAKAKYHACKLQSTPNWSELDKIKVVYEKAQWLESLTGLKYHVDHIVPLQGKNVCGLHCWENLQILEAGLNIGKGNRYE